MIGIDTNLLVYAHREGVPQHLAARHAIERAGRNPEGWGFALSCIAEFWCIATHPSALGGPAPADRVVGFFQGLAASGGQVWFPGARFAERLLQLAAQFGVQGVRVFDLQIALTAFDNGATEIWTHDRQFTSLPGIRVHDPL